MAAKLIIRFHPPIEEEVDWLILQSDGESQEGKGSLSDIPWPEEAWVMVLVPTIQLALTQIEIPRMKWARLRVTVPYVIEEYLTSDLSDLHIAISEFNEEGKVSVVAVKHDLLQEWLQRLKEADISPDVLLPDIWYLPQMQETWAIWVEPKLALIKTAKDEGFAVDLHNMKAMLDMKWHEYEQSGKQKPDKIELFFSDQISRELLNELFKNNDLYQLSMNPISGSFLSFISDQLPEKTPFNLLQAPYETKKKWSKLKKKWLPVCTLFGILLILFFVKSFSEFFYLKHQIANLKKQALSLYQEVLPEVTDSESSRARLQRELDRILLTAKGNPFFKALNQVIPTLKASNVVLTGFEYKDQMLTLNVEAHQLQVIDTLIQAVKAQGILVERKNTIQQEDKVTSQLVVKK